MNVRDPKKSKGTLFLHSRLPPDVPREQRKLKLIQFNAPQTMWLQLAELAGRETSKRGVYVSQAMIIRRAVKRELHESFLKLQEQGA